jgi:transcriptional regulator with XRE-family HTH domain
MQEEGTVPQATPKRSERKPKPGGRFPSQILADNVRVWRGLRGFSQAQLAERMSRLGHGWSESIVGFVEQNRRNVTVDELIGLTIALNVRQLGSLLDPLGPEGEHRYGPPGPRAPDDGNGLDWGGGKPLPGPLASYFVRNQTSFHVAFEKVTGEPVPAEELGFVQGYASYEEMPKEQYPWTDPARSGMRDEESQP